MGRRIVDKGNKSGRRARCRNVFHAMGIGCIKPGFFDGLRGAGFRPEYERWPEIDQIRYELGRRCGIVVAHYMEEIRPAWKIADIERAALRQIGNRALDAMERDANAESRV